MIPLSSWGRLSRNPHTVIQLTDRHTSAGMIVKQQPGICYGNGRSYGDVCLNSQGIVWQTRQLDKLISFDPYTGILRCEAGVLLRDIQRLLAPRGWLLPVTPGTQLITVGGAIANDVHGKNHHAFGTFGEHVTALTLLRTDGSVIECTPGTEGAPAGNHAALFRATVGGLGLTGVIVEASLKLRRVSTEWLDSETVPYRSLDAFFKLAEDSESDWEHTVSWIDCLSGTQPRGIFLRANHAEQNPQKTARRSGRKLNIPVSPPVSLVNRLTLKPFNTLYYHRQASQSGRHKTHYESFFYPLDSIENWNRMYGRSGFYQYQCVIPTEQAQPAIAELLQQISRSGQGSFLAVLKTFASRPAAGLLSFPMAGATLALDFPNKGKHTLTLLTRLDSIVSQAGGRLYPAKDSRMPANLFARGYPNLPAFLQYRDPGITSDMARRLLPESPQSIIGDNHNDYSADE